MRKNLPLSGRKLRRIMKGENGEHGATGGAGGVTTPPGGGNNGGGQGEGNSASGTSGAGDSNNTGEQFDPSSFWNGPAPIKDAAPPGESAGGTGGESGNNGEGTGQPQGQFATQLSERLNGLTFGEPLFTAEIAEQINEGNYEGIQGRFQSAMQQAVRESLAMNVQILRPFAEQLMEQVRNETKQTFNSRDNQESLVTLFPAAKNPVMAKTIQPIYDQALKNSGGDRTKAVTQTKEMLRFMAGESAADLNIDIAPRGQGDRGGPTPNFNWLDELTAR